MRAAASSHISSGGGVGETAPFQSLPYTRPDPSSALRAGASSSAGRVNAPTGSGDHQNVDDFVKSFDAELALLRKTGEVQRQKQQSWNSTSYATSSLSTTYPSGQRYVPASNSSTSTQIDAHASDDYRDFLGLGVQVAQTAEGTLVVSSILPNGASGQLQQGDLILSVDGHDPHSKGLAETIRESIVHVHVRSRNGGMQIVPVQRMRRSPYSSQSSSTVHLSSGSTEIQNGAQLSRSLPAPPGRTFPARALMQWDYLATREDEMTAKAGEVIVITGEYKNAGWLWGSKLAAGVATSSSLLVPANYIAYLAPTQATPAPSNPSLSTGLSSASSRAPMYSAISQAAVPRETPVGPSSTSSYSEPPAHLTPVHSLPQSSSVAMQPGAPAPSQQPANVVSSMQSTQQQEEIPDHIRLRMAEDEDDGMEFVVGDAADPILDGMYEDESGRISINC